MECWQKGKFPEKFLFSWKMLFLKKESKIKRALLLQREPAESVNVLFRHVSEEQLSESP